MRVSGTEGYAETADRLAEQYESRRFADVHKSILPLIPTTPCRVLDIGAGTGRDAAGLAAMGHRVLAVEPTAEMRAHSRRLHSSSAIDWIDDSLPALAQVHARGERFDLVMMTAVWMHLDDAERRRGMAQVRSLIAPAGLLTLSLRHGPIPAGRRMFEVTSTETKALAAEHGLNVLVDRDRPSSFGAEGVWWSVLAFQAQDA